MKPKKKKRRKPMPFYDVDSASLIQAMCMARDKQYKRQRRFWGRIWKGEVVSSETIRRVNRNCQCNIDPEYCPIHGDGNEVAKVRRQV